MQWCQLFVGVVVGVGVGFGVNVRVSVRVEVAMVLAFVWGSVSVWVSTLVSVACPKFNCAPVLNVSCSGGSNLFRLTGMPGFGRFTVRLKLAPAVSTRRVWRKRIARMSARPRK
eukprot:356126-Chlamydomonas_euryale.AAC.10